jgi:hypothetical protein
MDISQYQVGDHLLICLSSAEDEVNTMDIQIYRKLTDEQRDEFLKAISSVSKWIKQDNDAFQILEYSYTMLVQTATSLEAAYKQVPRPDGDDSLLAMNAGIMHLLSSMRLYLDHTLTRLAHEGGLGDELQAHKDAASREFDDVFAYRFFSKLRNFAQHCGSPITILAATSSLNEDDTFDIQFDRDYLLNEFDKWGAIVKRGLETMPEKFSVMELADEFMWSMRRIREVTIKAYVERISSDLDLLKSLIAETAGCKGSPHIAVIVSDESAGNGMRNKKITFKNFPRKLIAISDIFRA